jgi:hypothetical protein
MTRAPRVMSMNERLDKQPPSRERDIILEALGPISTHRTNAKKPSLRRRVKSKCCYPSSRFLYDCPQGE